MPDLGNSVFPWRRYLRFSVRGMIVLVLVVGVWLGWIVRGARIQRDAVAAIVGDHNVVRYEWWYNTGNAAGRREPWAPRWLVRLVGVDYFGNVVGVALGQASQEELIQVGRLGKVRYLQIKMPREASDAELARLSGLSNLKALDLSGTRVSDVGLTHLRSLPSLSSLDLGFTNVSDAGLAQLEGMTQIADLVLSHTRITSGGIAHLQVLAGLQMLDLSATDVGDDGLTHLENLMKLDCIDLSGTNVTDAGLTHLKRLTKLTSLHVEATRVTDASVGDLLQALPNLAIHR